MKAIALVFISLMVPVLLGAGSSSSSTSSPARHQKYFDRGVEAQKQKDFEAAVKWYKKALSVKADYPDALNNLGFSYRMIAWGYLEEAAGSYENALRIDPDHDEALEYQGELFLWRGELSRAQRNYERLKILGSPEAGELGRKLDKVLNDARGLL